MQRQESMSGSKTAPSDRAGMPANDAKRVPTTLVAQSDSHPQQLETVGARCCLCAPVCSVAANEVHGALYFQRKSDCTTSVALDGPSALVSNPSQGEGYPSS